MQGIIDGRASAWNSMQRSGVLREQCSAAAAAHKWRRLRLNAGFQLRGGEAGSASAKLVQVVQEAIARCTKWILGGFCKGFLYRLDEESRVDLREQSNLELRASKGEGTERYTRERAAKAYVESTSLD